MVKNNYLEGVGINYTGTLPKIKKSKNYLQPIFKAFTNSLESIKLLKKIYEPPKKGSIRISLFFTKNLHSNATEECDFKIGENIDIDDIQDNDSDFKSAHSLNFIYRPYKRIIGKFGKNNGSLYREVIKYSTLLERAQQRNKIFIDKLLHNQKDTSHE